MLLLPGSPTLPVCMPYCWGLECERKQVSLAACLYPELAVGRNMGWFWDFDCLMWKSSSSRQRVLEKGDRRGDLHAWIRGALGEKPDVEHVPPCSWMASRGTGTHLLQSPSVGTSTVPRLRVTFSQSLAPVLTEAWGLFHLTVNLYRGDISR